MIKPMGTFTAKFKIAPLAKPDSQVEVEGHVDTGAAYPFVPESVLRSVGIVPTSEKTFVLADGTRRIFTVGEVRFTYDGGSAPCLVVFAPDGTEPLFGALALESLGLDVDPVARTLKPATLYLA